MRHEWYPHLASFISNCVLTSTFIPHIGPFTMGTRSRNFTRDIVFRNCRKLCLVCLVCDRERKFSDTFLTMAEQVLSQWNKERLLSLAETLLSHRSNRDQISVCIDRVSNPDFVHWRLGFLYEIVTLFYFYLLFNVLTWSATHRKRSLLQYGARVFLYHGIKFRCYVSQLRHTFTLNNHSYAIAIYEESIQTAPFANIVLAAVRDNIPIFNMWCTFSSML